jgi:hypothetical protein
MEDSEAFQHSEVGRGPPEHKASLHKQSHSALDQKWIFMKKAATLTTMYVEQRGLDKA